MVFDFLPHTECAVNKKKLKLGQIQKLVVVAFEPICMLTMPFSKKFKFWFFYECLKSLGKLIFLAPTQ
jgi:hypothetical protein